MPLYTVYILSAKTWPLGEILCDLWLSLDYTACLCSIYTVFCITVDRFCSIRFPARYRTWRTERKARCSLILIHNRAVVLLYISVVNIDFYKVRIQILENEYSRKIHSNIRQAFRANVHTTAKYIILAFVLVSLQFPCSFRELLLLLVIHCVCVLKEDTILTCGERSY